MDCIYCQTGGQGDTGFAKNTIVAHTVVVSPPEGGLRDRRCELTIVVVLGDLGGRVKYFISRSLLDKRLVHRKFDGC